MIIILFISLCLCLCVGLIYYINKTISNKKINNEKVVKKPVSDDKNDIEPIDIPEGVRLTGFYINHIGMAMEPHYIVKTTENGTCLKITNLSPDDWQMSDLVVDGENKNTSDKYFKFADVVLDIEYGNVVLLEDDKVVKELEKVIEKVGALGWDGYNEHVSMDGVLDAGDSYNLYMEFSDGKTVTMYGYNSCPKGFDELMLTVITIFDNNCSYY